MKKESRVKKPDVAKPKAKLDKLSNPTAVKVLGNKAKGQVKRGKGESAVNPDQSTEEKIRTAALKVFTAKGYYGTRTRDIAEEAGINLALLNYYFRSKEKLFEIIMMDTVRHFMQGIVGVVHNEETSLEFKIHELVNQYLDLLVKQPNLPLFVLHELHANPGKFISVMGADKLLHGSSFLKQLQQHAPHGIPPIHFLMNILSLTVFPFVAKPLVQAIGNMDQANYLLLMEQRRKLIPAWILTLIKNPVK